MPRKRRKGGIENVGKFFAEEDNHGERNSFTKAFKAANRKSHVEEAEQRLL